MTLGKRRVVSALQKKGFEKDVDGKHIVLMYRTLDGDLSGIKTHVSHGSRPKDLNDYLIGQMARQVKLPKKSFEQLVLYPMKQPEYEKIIEEKL